MVISAERARQTPTELMRSLRDRVGEQLFALSSVGYTELVNGVYRDTDPARRQRRELFLGELLAYLPVIPYTLEIADLAGRIGGQQAALGLTVPFVDLMIGATALSRSYAVLTSNTRHFKMIPHLNVITV